MPHTRQSFKALQLKAKTEVHSSRLGEHLSRYHAQGHDFAELREYHAGDDIRKIHWMTTAKLGKPYIKEFHAHRELSIVLAVFMDASLYFGSGNAKQERLCEIASLLGYATIAHNDLFQGFCYTQEHNYSTPPSKQAYDVAQFTQNLFELPLLGTTLDYKQSLQMLFQSIPRPSLLFILSDCLEEIDLSLLAQKHEVVVICIRDEAEHSQEALGEVTLSNPHNHSHKEQTMGKKSIANYLAILDKHDQASQNKWRQNNIRHLCLTTQENVLAKLLAFFR